HAAAAEPPLRGPVVNQFDEFVCLQVATATPAQVSGNVPEHGGDGGGEPADYFSALGSIGSRDPQQPRTMAETVVRSARTDQICPGGIAALYRRSLGRRPNRLDTRHAHSHRGGQRRLEDLVQS